LFFCFVTFFKTFSVCKTIEGRIGTTCFSAKNCLFCEPGKLKAEEEEEEKQLFLGRIGEGAVSLMFWKF
jgi:hypothetical protein